MKPKNENIARDDISPLEMTPKNVEEENLKTTLEILVASGKVTKDDVFMAWRLAFTA